MSEYIFVTNIFEYSNIRIYSSHSVLVTLRHNQSPRSHQVVQTHTSSTTAQGSTGQCCRQTTERPSRNCKAGRAWLQFHHVLCLMNPIAWPAWPSTLWIDFYLKHFHPVYNISLHCFRWDGMGWESLAGTGVATAQKNVERPTPFLTFRYGNEKCWRKIKTIENHTFFVYSCSS